MTNSRRKTAGLPVSLHQQLNRYVLAASTAGVGMLALTQPAEAKVVYTPAHMKLVLHGRFPIDLNHDGTPDLTFYHWGEVNSASAASGLMLSRSYAPASNGVVAFENKEGTNDAVAIPAGKQVGPLRPFASGARLGTAVYDFLYRSTKFAGQWANQGKGLKDRYAGLRFVIDGKLHFGWARISIAVQNHTLIPVLTGYAYETIPNKPIITGATEDQDATMHGTLGSLAAGKR